MQSLPVIIYSLQAHMFAERLYGISTHGNTQLIASSLVELRLNAHIRNFATFRIVSRELLFMRREGERETVRERQRERETETETREGKDREEKIILMLEGVRTSVRLKPSPVIKHNHLATTYLCLDFRVFVCNFCFQHILF